MSNVIKSAAVVDRQSDAGGVLLQICNAYDRSVIKRGDLSRGQVTVIKPPPTRDALLAELNRVRVEIEDAEKELRARQREIDAAQREVDALEERRAALEKLGGLGIDEQAEAILRDAEEKANQMIDWARQQAADSVDQLKAQGYIDGLEQGASEAHERFLLDHEPDIRKLELMMVSLSQLKDEVIRENENDIVSLIVAVAEKVIGRSLKDDPRVVVDMLREVLDQNRRESYVKVLISPDLLPAEAKVRDNILEMIRQLGHQVEVAVDSEALPGSIVAETPGGITDLGVETQLDNIHEILLED